jgi:hypothetical protein
LVSRRARLLHYACDLVSKYHRCWDPLITRI